MKVVVRLVVMWVSFGATWGIVACTGLDAEPNTGAVASAITEEECGDGAVDGKVAICHATGSPANPYMFVQVARQACLAGHRGHAGDFISTDPSCTPPPCLTAAAGTVCRPASSACDPAETCDGVMLSCPPDVSREVGVGCEDVSAMPELQPPESLPAIDGETLTYQSGVVIGVPDGAVTMAGHIEATLREVQELPVAPESDAPIEGTGVGVGVELQPSGMTFARPIEIRMPLVHLMTPYTLVAIMQYDGASGAFVPARLTDGSLISGLSTADGSAVVFIADHFTIYSALVPAVVSTRFTRKHTWFDGRPVSLAVPEYLFYNSLSPTGFVFDASFRARTYETIFYELFLAKDRARPDAIRDLSKFVLSGISDPQVIETARDVKYVVETIRWFAEVISRDPDLPIVTLDPLLTRVESKLGEITDAGTLSGAGIAYLQCVIGGYLSYLVVGQVDQFLIEDRIAALRPILEDSPLWRADPELRVGFDAAARRVRSDLADDTNHALTTLADNMLGDARACVETVAWDIGKDYIIDSMAAAVFGAGSYGPFVIVAAKLIEDYLDNDVLAANRNATRLTLLGSLYEYGGMRAMVPEQSQIVTPVADVDLGDVTARRMWINRQTTLDLLGKILDAQEETVSRADLSVLSRGIAWIGSDLAGLFSSNENDIRLRIAGDIAAQRLLIDFNYDRITDRLTSTCAGGVACLRTGMPFPDDACAAVEGAIAVLTPGAPPIRDYACAQTQRQYLLQAPSGHHVYRISTVIAGGDVATFAAATQGAGRP